MAAVGTVTNAYLDTFPSWQRKTLKRLFTDGYTQTGPLTVSGGITGDLTGNVTGNVTGTVIATRAALAAAGTDATNGGAIATQIVAVTASDGTKGVVLPAAATTVAPILVINTV